MSTTLTEPLRIRRPESQTGERVPWISPLGTFLGLIWCLLVLCVHLMSGALACDSDTSYCAASPQKDVL